MHNRHAHLVPAIIAAVFVFTALSCDPLGTGSPAEKEDPGTPLAPAEDPAIVINDAPFSLEITEKRFSKVINWKAGADGKLTSDYERSGDLVVTDWNTVTVRAVSDDPAFNGVKVQVSGADGIIVRRAAQGPDSLKVFSLSHNPDRKEQTWGNTLIFSAGSHSISLSLSACEYVNIQSVVIELNTMPGEFNYKPTGEVLPKGHIYNYINDIRLFDFVGGKPADNRSPGFYEIPMANKSDGKFGKFEVKYTIRDVRPQNTSWRLVDLSTLPPEEKCVKAHPELNWVMGPMTAVDIDDIVGKELLHMGFDIISYVNPKPNPKEPSGWEKVGFKTVIVRNTSANVGDAPEFEPK